MIASTDCGRCASPLEAEDLRCAVCGFATPPDHLAGRSEVPRATIVRCQECNAAVTYSIEAQAPTCAFCGATAHVEEIVDPIDQAEVVFPFVVDPSGARDAFSRWLGSLGWFRPSDLTRAAKVDALLPVWWPAWVFDAEALVSWTADSNAGARRSAWAPHAGQQTLVFDDVVVPASRGLSDHECWQLLPYSQLVGAGCDPRTGPAGATVERFETQRSAARQRILAVLEETAAARLQLDVIPGTNFRNVSVVPLIRALRTRRVAIPAYVFAYRYGGKVYRAIVHGQNATCTFGSSPLSWAKVMLAVAIAAGVIALCVAALSLA